jgi:hypothetical protein
MASGHVNRTNRPNTWLHRPSLRREDSPCQPGAVHTWHDSDDQSLDMSVHWDGADSPPMMLLGPFMTLPVISRVESILRRFLPC